MPGISDVEWPKHTERLQLRPATTADLEFCWRLRGTGSVAEWLTEGPADLASFAAKAIENERVASTLIVELAGVPIADLMLRVEDGWAQGEVTEQAVAVQAELGWILDPAYGGHGYATEAVRELVRIAFEDLGLRRVTALCFADNTPSWTLMERIGLRREAHNVADSLHRTHGWVDGFVYAQLATEWQGRPTP